MVYQGEKNTFNMTFYYYQLQSEKNAIEDFYLSSFMYNLKIYISFLRNISAFLLDIDEFTRSQHVAIIQPKKII